MDVVERNFIDTQIWFTITPFQEVGKEVDPLRKVCYFKYTPPSDAVFGETVKEDGRTRIFENRHNDEIIWEACKDIFLRGYNIEELDHDSNLNQDDRLISKLTGDFCTVVGLLDGGYEVTIDNKPPSEYDGIAIRISYDTMERYAKISPLI